MTSSQIDKKIEDEPFEYAICPQFIISGKLKPPLTSMEKKLICGLGESSNNEGWTSIPLSQAEFHFTNFLQDRGYHQPHFKQVEGRLIVEIGNRTHIKKIEVQGISSDMVDITRKRDIIDQPLTPRALEATEVWIERKLSAMGFACPQVESFADPLTGLVQVKVDPGPRQSLMEIREEPVPGLNKGILTRYYAFEVGQPFNRDLLDVTERRILTSGVVVSNHFHITCKNRRVDATHKLVPGPPRLLSFGVGLNTEGIIRAKSSWKHIRLGPNATLFDISLFGTGKVQTLKTSLNWYLFPEVTRNYLGSVIEVTNQNQQHFQSLSTRGEVGLGTTSDYQNFAANFFIGPAFDYITTLRGVGSKDSHFLNLETRIALKSHDFEFYADNPRTGYHIQTITDLNSGSFFSNVSAQRIGLRGELLWNVGAFDPPLWVVGIRGGFNTVLTAEQAVPGTLLPGNFLQYLGGSVDLRGFDLQELPRKPNHGGLTSAFLGMEVRLNPLALKGVNPFVFFDMGAIGMSPISLNLPLYLSPGFGVRWASPIGSFRTTLAHGYSNDPKDGLQFFINYGEEF